MDASDSREMLKRSIDLLVFGAQTVYAAGVAVPFGTLCWMMENDSAIGFYNFADRMEDPEMREVLLSYAEERMRWAPSLRDCIGGFYDTHRPYRL